MPRVTIDFETTEHGVEDARNFIEEVLAQNAPHFCKTYKPVVTLVGESDPSVVNLSDLANDASEALARVASTAAANVAFVDGDRLVVLPNACPELPGEQGSGHEDDPRAAASIDVLRFLVADYEAERE